MKATIEVKDKHERDALRIGLEDRTVRACAIMLGVLNSLNDRDRKHVLNFVIDRLHSEGPDVPPSILGDGR